MPAVRRADVVWEGDLLSGSGVVTASSSRAFAELPVSWASRTEAPGGRTSPEELIAAAHAACFSMAFSNGLAKAGHKPERLDTRVEIEFVPGTGITTSTITVRGHIHGIGDDEFQKLAKEAEEGCPVSKAMHGNVELRLHATLDAAH